MHARPALVWVLVLALVTFAALGPLGAPVGRWLAPRFGFALRGVVILVWGGMAWWGLRSWWAERRPRLPGALRAPSGTLRSLPPVVSLATGIAVLLLFTLPPHLAAWAAPPAKLVLGHSTVRWFETDVGAWLEAHRASASVGVSSY